MPNKTWRRRPAPPAGFAQTLGLPPFQAHLLYNRGIRRPEEMEEYLDAGPSVLKDPSLLPDMRRATARIERALAEGEVVGVFGDFDTDGVAGTALLVHALRGMGATVIPYLPDRTDEGHGLNPRAVQWLRSQGVSLLVTVDCGSTSVDEVRLASSLGIDTVITDHHSLPTTLPDAEAVVNPRRADSTYPYDGLTGAGLSFKLAVAVHQAKGLAVSNHLIELAALGTVADVGPLTGENRYLVKRGLELLNETSHPGLRALIATAGLKPGTLDTESLSFGLIPRLNAAGRLADASLSLDLLTASSAETAGPIAEELETRNQERRQLTKEGVAEAHRQVGLYRIPIPPIIFVEHEEWKPGILGLIAGSLSEHYYRPVVAVSLNGGVCRASARSVPEFDIAEALRECGGLFRRFGGHPRAAGFTASTQDLPRVKQALTSSAQEQLAGIDMTPALDIDCEISPGLLNEHNFNFIQSLGPFGEANSAPTFLTRSARVAGARKVGKDGDHLKMWVQHGGQTWEAIAFRQGQRAPVPGDGVNLVYTVGLDHWGDQPRLQLNVLDFRPGP